MCRNIRPLFNFEPPATDDEIHAAALQFVRKVSGFNQPSKANEAAFDAAVEAIASVSRAASQRAGDHSAAQRSRYGSGEGARPLRATLWLLSARTSSSISRHRLWLTPKERSRLYCWREIAPGWFVLRTEGATMRVAECPICHEEIEAETDEELFAKGRAHADDEACRPAVHRRADSLCAFAREVTSAFRSAFGADTPPGVSGFISRERQAVYNC